MFGRNILLVVLLLLWKHDLATCIRIVKLIVPTHVPEGGTALIDCQYDLEGDTLYSVKWYKNHHEIHRYAPIGNPSTRYYQRPGVYIDKERSSNSRIALTNITQETRDWYTCEVSGESPAFYTVAKRKFMDVYLLPKTGPTVEGLKKVYNFDDFIRANCSISATKPKVELQWFVNGNPALDLYTTGPWYRVSDERPDATSTILQLNFLATSIDFINGTLKLKCQATIAPLYQAETASVHYITQYLIATTTPSSEPLKEDPNHAVSLTTQRLSIFTIAIIFLALII